MLRSIFQAAAPLLFGYVSTRFGKHTSGLDATAGNLTHGAGGLRDTFLIMLAPLLASAALLLLAARKTYPRDVATAAASERGAST